MKKPEGPKNYWMVQAGIGTLEVGGLIGYGALMALTNQVMQNIFTYARPMNCVKPIHEDGNELITLFKRIAMPGKVCEHCPEIEHCILRLIAEDMTNLRFLPRELALLQEIE